MSAESSPTGNGHDHPPVDSFVAVVQYDPVTVSGSNSITVKNSYSTLGVHTYVHIPGNNEWGEGRKQNWIKIHVRFVALYATVFVAKVKNRIPTFDFGRLKTKTPPKCHALVGYPCGPKPYRADGEYLCAQCKQTISEISTTGPTYFNRLLYNTGFIRSDSSAVLFLLPYFSDIRTLWELSPSSFYFANLPFLTSLGHA